MSDARNRTLLQNCCRLLFPKLVLQGTWSRFGTCHAAQVRRAQIEILPKVASTFGTCLRGFPNKLEHNWWAFVNTDVCEHPGDGRAADGTRRKNAGERLLILVAAAAWRNLVPVPRALDGAGPDACTSIAQYLNLIALECHAQGRRCMTAQEGARDGTRPTCCYHRPLGDGHLVIHPEVRDSRRTLNHTDFHANPRALDCLHECPNAIRPDSGEQCHEISFPLLDAPPV